MRFDAFMRDALYHPDRGYYRRARDPFGADGDFFTASQLQPVFGRIVAAEIARLAPGDTVLELGPGRGELAEAFPHGYEGVEFGESLPEVFEGVAFANEFFDALPVRVVISLRGELYEGVVERGELTAGPVLDAEARAYVGKYWPYLAPEGRAEIPTDALAWIDKLGKILRRGYAMFIDYGYTTPETVRFPQGTLMSYRRHAALSCVASHPGERDITSHVPFDALIDRAVACGFRFMRLETLASLTLRNLERDPNLAENFAERQQLKTLLYGMGETFRCLTLAKAAG